MTQSTRYRKLQISDLNHNQALQYFLTSCTDETADSVTVDVQRCVCLCGNLGDTEEYCGGGGFSRFSWP